MSAQSEADDLRRLYDRSAPRYDRTIRWAEPLLFVGGRRWVCRRAGGEVLEIAVDTGRGRVLYRQDVRLTGIDLSSQMLAIARDRAEELALEVDLRLGDAQALPFADGRFDTVVCTLVCAVSPMSAKRCARPGACCAPAAG